MDTLLDMLFTISQVFGAFLAVSVIISSLFVLYLLIGLVISDLRRAQRVEQYEKDDMNDIEDYLAQDAENEKYFNQIEEYRNDFS